MPSLWLRRCIAICEHDEVIQSTDDNRLRLLSAQYHIQFQKNSSHVIPLCLVLCVQPYRRPRYLATCGSNLLATLAYLMYASNLRL